MSLKRDAGRCPELHNPLHNEVYLSHLAGQQAFPIF